MARGSFLAHRGSDGSMPGDRAERAGFSWIQVAENVAGGQISAAEVVDTWLASPGHCANLMSADFTHVGHAVTFDAGSEMGNYWAQIFATR